MATPIYKTYDRRSEKYNEAKETYIRKRMAKKLPVDENDKAWCMARMQRCMDEFLS